MLDQLGARDGASVDQINEVFGIDLFAMLRPDGAEAGQGPVADESDDPEG